MKPYKRLTETVKYKYVVRDGKKVRKPTTDREGYKITYDDDKPEETKMSSQEIRKHSKGSIKGSRKKTGKQSSITTKRKKSLKKRTWD